MSLSKKSKSLLVLKRGDKVYKEIKYPKTSEPKTNTITINHCKFWSLKNSQRKIPAKSNTHNESENTTMVRIKKTLSLILKTVSDTANIGDSFFPKNLFEIVDVDTN